MERIFGVKNWHGVASAAAEWRAPLLSLLGAVAISAVLLLVTMYVVVLLFRTLPSPDLIPLIK